MRTPISPVILVLAGALGCGESTAPRGGALSGRWAGEPTNFYPLTFTLVHADSVLTGRGTAGTTPPQQIAVIGRARPSGSVNLTIASENLVPGLFVGTVSADGRTLTGSLGGSGLTAATVTFRRE